MYTRLATQNNCIKILWNMFQTLKSFLILLGPKAIMQHYMQIVVVARKQKLPWDLWEKTKSKVYSIMFVVWLMQTHLK